MYTELETSNCMCFSLQILRCVDVTPSAQFDCNELERKSMS